MLFSKDYSHLLLVPEGKEGAAHIPDQTNFVPALGISRCPGLLTVEVGEGGAAFSSYNAQLFSKDMKTLVAAPAGIGTSVVLPAEVETVGEYALAGCKDLTSITALGTVREIDPSAFADEVKASAVVALPAGKDFDERKAVWEAAGFQHFAEPAEPGVTVGPEAGGSNADAGSGSEVAASGFVFTLLDDYTLSVGWEGAEDPAAEVEIPASAEINGVSYRVSTIAANAFANRGSLTSVTLPATVTSLSKAAFAGCANLTSIQLPDTLRELGERAFEATGLTDVWLPASVQSIGPRAFASCDSLTRIVALGTPQVADDTLASCVNLSLYCPYNADNTYPWNLGLIANNNHLMPYGLTLPQEPLTLEAGQQANLFENALYEVPEPCGISYSYAAKPLSVDEGIVSGKKEGSSEVTAILSLDGIELTCSSRMVEVRPSTLLKQKEEGQRIEKDTSFHVPITSLVASLDDSEINTFAVESKANIAGPSTWGSCTWVIDSTGLLTIYPTNGTSGTLNSISDNAPWKPYQASITSVVVNPGVIAGTAMHGMFANCSNLKSADLHNLNTNNVRDMVSIFYDCLALTTANVSGFNTANVTDMSWMFSGCLNLQSVDVSGFNTSKVTNMSMMFSGCSSLTSLDVSGFNTSKVQDASSMFFGCSTLQALDISGFNTVSMKNMNRMFARCSKLLSLDISGFNTVNTTDMGRMFDDCNSLTSLDVSHFNTTKVTSMEAMFEGLWNVPSLNLSSFNTQNVENMAAMFSGCRGLTSLDVSHFNTSKITSMSWMFNDCPKLRSLDLSTFNTAGVTEAFQMFAGCISLTSLDLTNFNTVNITNMKEMFRECKKLEQLVLPNNFIGTKVTDISNMFSYCNNLKTLPQNLTFGNLAIPQGCFAADGETALPTLYRGNDAKLLAYNWKGDNRALKANIAGPTVHGGCTWLIDGYGGLFVYPTNGVSGTLPAFYFDNNPWNAYKGSITSVKFNSGVIAGTSTMGMFSDCINLKTVDLGNFNTQNVTSMLCMFAKCKQLTSLSVSGFNTANVDSLQQMFDGCSSLKSLDLSNFNTSKVTNFAHMFYECSGLTSLDLSNFVTTNATDMGAMFQKCTNLTSVNVSSFNTANVKNMIAMFSECYSLRSLDVSGFQTGNVIEMRYLFNGCKSLSSLDVSNFDTSEAQNMGWMFVGCSGLTSLDVSGFNTAKVETMNAMFNGCSSLTSLDLSKFNTAKVETMEEMLRDCSKLSKLILSDNFIGTTVTNVSNMFANCNSLTTLPANLSFGSLAIPQGCFAVSGESVLSTLYRGSDMKLITYNWGGDNRKLRSVVTGPETCGTCSWLIDDEGGLLIYPTDGSSGTLDYISYDAPWNGYKESITSVMVDPGVSANEGISGLFVDCTSLKTANLKNLNTANTKYMDSIFSGCTGLTSVDVSGLNTANAITMESFFSRCSSLPSVDVSSFDTRNVKNMRWMFFLCSGLTSLDVTGFNTENVTDMFAMFNECSSLSSLDVTHFNTAKVENMAEMFQKCSGLTALDVSGFQTGAVRDINSMFMDCSKVTSLDVSGFDTSNVTVMNHMFSGCSQLTLLDVSGFKTDAVTNMSHLFNDCSSLTSLDVSHFNTVNVTAMDAMFQRCKNLQSINVSSFNTGNVEGMGAMFSGCKSLSALDVSGFATSNVTHMDWMFYDCSGLATLDVSHFDTANVTDMQALFASCEQLTSLDISQFNTSQAVNLASMFDHCVALISIKLPDNFIGPKVTGVANLFAYCNNLTTLPANLVFGNLDIPQGSFAVVSVSPKGTLYEGPDQKLLTYDWGADNRMLNQFTLTFNASGGNPTPLSQTVVYGTCAVEPKRPALEGHTFGGWYTGENGTGEKWVFGSTVMPGNDVILYAKWWGEEEKWQFAFNEDGQSLSITLNPGFRESVEEIEIPAEHLFEGSTYPVTTIGANAFSDCSSLASVIIPASISAIEKEAFNHCPQLTTIYADGSMDVIDSTSFEDSTKLNAKVVLPLVSSGGMGFEQMKNFWESHGFKVANILASSGTLPTTDSGENASWSLSIDGTLTIRCDVEGAVVDAFGWDENTYREDGRYWSPLRDQVKNIVLDPSFDAIDMEWWFAGMTGLTFGPDITLPKSVKSVKGLFGDCASMIGLPETFVLPDDIEKCSHLFIRCASLKKLPTDFRIPANLNDPELGVNAMFSGCASLESLPEGFTIPDIESLTNVNGIFKDCSSLVSVPDSFRIPSRVQQASGVFRGCTSLVSLPEGFALPSAATNLEYFFYNCTSLQKLPSDFTLPSTMHGSVREMFHVCSSLTTLPEGFTIPSSVTNVKAMFKDCSSLSSLPEGFTIPQDIQFASNTMMEKMFKGCDRLTVLPDSFDFPLTVANASTEPFKALSDDTLTYYAGKSEAVKAFDWTSQSRNLVLAGDSDNPLPDNTHLVSFVLPDMAKIGEWVPYANVLTGADGKVADPGDPGRFGYQFLGWYADPDYQNDFDFENTVPAGDIHIYGKFGAPILRFEAPIQAMVEIDAAGTVSTAKVEARSFTPVEVNVQGLRLEVMDGASQVFGNPSQVSALVQFSNGTPYTVPLGGEVVATSVTAPVSSGFANPGLLFCTVSMDLGGTTLRYIPDASTEVAALVWTVSL